MTMDITETTAANSAQQNYDDYLGGNTRTVTVTEVNKGTAEQPVNLELAEFPGRPFKPNKTMRRLLVLAWGADSKNYIGRRLTLGGNPDVVFGGKAVGGVEIQALSHIDKPLTVALTATRGKRKNFTVQVLSSATPTAPTIPEVDLSAWLDRFNDAATMADLGAAWDEATSAGVTKHPQLIAAKDARKAEITRSQQ